MVYFLPGHVINIITLLTHCHTSIQRQKKKKKKDLHFMNTHSMVSYIVDCGSVDIFFIYFFFLRKTIHFFDGDYNSIDFMF